MNCEEYRLAIGGNTVVDGAAGHVALCSDCQAYTQELASLNLKLARAMQLDVPELTMPDLPEIETTNVTALPVTRRSTMPLCFVVAGTFVLATSITVRMSGMFETYDSLADEVLAHVDHEPAALRVTTTPVTNEKLQRALPATMAVFDRNESLITYARLCKINGNTVPHLVVQGQYGPVTILLMPEETVTEAMLLDGENVHGIILPVGDGSIAIIGAREEPLEPIQKNVMDSVTWTT